MRSGISCVLVAVLLALSCPLQVTAADLYIKAKFEPEAGSVSDADILGDNVVLLYPDKGHMAEYTPEGRLFRHIILEGGIERRFVPTVCTDGPDGRLIVFDEANLQFYAVNDEGNFNSGRELAWPLDEGGALALSRIGDMCYVGNDRMMVLVNHEGMIAAFDGEGELQEKTYLPDVLPYSNSAFARIQALADGSLFVLDYNQGAVIYRKGNSGSFRRMRLDVPEGLSAAPTLQDFAADEKGRMLAITNADDNKVILLQPSGNGYTSHAVKLGLPPGSHRMACRYSRGRFILWLRDEPLVYVLQVS